MQADASTRVAIRPFTLWLLTFGGFFSFFAFGFVDNLKGPTLPNLLQELNFSYSQGGGILFAAYLGFVIATLLTGPLSDLLGNRLLLCAAGLFMALGMVGLSTLATYPLLFGAMLVIGLGTGAIEVGGNGLIVALHRQAQGRFLNLLATFHGIGATLAPLFAAWLMAGGEGWRQLFLYSVPLALLLALLFAITPGPPAAQPGQHNLDWAVLRRRGFSPTMIAFYLAIGLYVATELGIAAWIVEYLIQSKGIVQTTAAYYLSVFFAFVMVGRLVGSVLVERIGYLRSILFAAIGALVCILLALLGPPALAFALPVSGLFCSIIFPTITAAVSRLHTQNTGTILGLLFTAGGIGGTLGPAAIGVVSDALGIQWGFGLNALFCTGAIMAIGVLLRRDAMSRETQQV
ncbi:MAG: MFS transporter [Caldilineaceae bacterium]|nr:MFS transporter [Caldilineaceae bacterium]